MTWKSGSSPRVSGSVGQQGAPRHRNKFCYPDVGIAVPDGAVGDARGRPGSASDHSRTVPSSPAVARSNRDRVQPVVRAGLGAVRDGPAVADPPQPQFVVLAGRAEQTAVRAERRPRDHALRAGQGAWHAPSIGEMVLSMGVGILAFGSLNDDPGDDLKAAAPKPWIPVETPFPVEFAHSSRRRDGAPTLVPVTKGGAHVPASILVLDSSVTVERAREMLYRRETNGLDPRPGAPADWIKEQKDVAGISTCLYAAFPADIQPLTPEELAKLALRSAAGPAGEQQRDGISYLKQQKSRGIETPLMASYEKAILESTGADDLDEAWELARLREFGMSVESKPQDDNSRAAQSSVPATNGEQGASDREAEHTRPEPDYASFADLVQAKFDATANVEAIRKAFIGRFGPIVDYRFGKNIACGVALTDRRAAGEGNAAIRSLPQGSDDRGGWP